MSVETLLVPNRTILTPAEAFFDFAFPAYTKCSRDKIQMARLRQMYVDGESPSMEELARLFPVGVFSLRRFIGDIHTPLSEIQSYQVQDYVRLGHNEMIDRGHMFLTHATDAESCRVNKGWIEDVIDDGSTPRIRVGYIGEQGRRDVFSYKVPSPRIGEIVLIHHDYAIGREQKYGS